jgi:nitroreductase
MNPIKGEQLLTQLNWRYATKKFDPTRKISPEDWTVLESALILSPSSYGLQPWKFIVITDHKTREKLFPATWNQRQVLDCSHYIVFAVNTRISEDYIDKHITRTAEVRGGTAQALKRFRDVIVSDIVTGDRAATAKHWATHQAYLALGNLLTSAALMGIDTCPMEGFEPEKYDEILDLAAKSLTSAVCCAAGYRSPDDKSASMKKVRFPREQVIHIV